MGILSRRFRRSLFGVGMTGLLVALSAHTLHQEATPLPPNLSLNVICENPVTIRITNEGGPMADNATYRVMHTSNKGSQASVLNGTFQLDSGHIFSETTEAQAGTYEINIYGRDGSIVTTYSEDCTQPPNITVNMECSPEALNVAIANEALTDRAAYAVTLDLTYDGQTRSLRSESVDLGAFDTSEWAVSPVEAGTYQLTVAGEDGASMGSFTAKCLETSTDNAISAGGGGVGGRAVVWPLLAVAGVMVVILIGGGFVWYRSTMR